MITGTSLGSLWAHKVPVKAPAQSAVTSRETGLNESARYRSGPVRRRRAVHRGLMGRRGDEEMPPGACLEGARVGEIAVEGQRLERKPAERTRRCGRDL